VKPKEPNRRSEDPRFRFLGKDLKKRKNILPILTTGRVKPKGQSWMDDMRGQSRLDRSERKAQARTSACAYVREGDEGKGGKTGEEKKAFA